MALYNLYYGLRQAEYGWTDEFNSLEEAEAAAHECAIEEYQCNEGSSYITSYDDVTEEYCQIYEVPDVNDLTRDDEEEILNRYQDIVERTIDYYAILATEDKNHIKGGN